MIITNQMFRIKAMILYRYNTVFGTVYRYNTAYRCNTVLYNRCNTVYGYSTVYGILEGMSWTLLI